MAKTTKTDIAELAKLKERLNPDRVVEVPVSVLEDIIDYCEYHGIYDKLGHFGDFYYKIKNLIK